MDIDLDSLKHSVQSNCNISDATYSGNYSICNLALRLRDLYKWEKDLNPWEETDSKIILEWIGEREEIWEDMVDGSFSPLSIREEVFEPFDTETINSRLAPHGLIYGAGYAYGLKPTFFLARCDETIREKGTTIHLMGQELARDLLTLPAMVQDKAVLLRKNCARLYLWDQIVYIRKSARPALAFALNTLGVGGSDLKLVKRRFEDVFAAQLNTYVYHELGEMRDTVFDHETWREVIAAYPQTPVELVARVVKDMLADTNEYGTLTYIMDVQNTAAMGFYGAFLGNFAGLLFPDLVCALDIFRRTPSWQSLKEAVHECHDTAILYAKTVTDIFLNGKADNNLPRAKEKIESFFLGKLKQAPKN